MAKVETTAESIATKLQLKESCPKLVGKVNGVYKGIAVSDWLENLETEFKENGVTTDSSKVARARSHIDYSEGTAGRLIKECEYKSFQELKEYITTWLDVPDLDIHDTYVTVTSLTWDSKTEGFEIFASKLLRITKKAENTKSFTKGFYFEMAKGIVLMAMPTEKLRKKCEKLLIPLTPFTTALDVQNFLTKVKKEIHAAKDADLKKNLGLEFINQDLIKIKQETEVVNYLNNRDGRFKNTTPRNTSANNSPKNNTPHFNPNPTPQQHRFIEQKACFNCQAPGHFSRDCSFCKICQTNSHHTRSCTRFNKNVYSNRYPRNQTNYQYPRNYNHFGYNNQIQTPNQIPRLNMTQQFNHGNNNTQRRTGRSVNFIEENEVIPKLCNTQEEVDIVDENTFLDAHDQ